MPTVTKQNAKGLKGASGVVGRIAPVRLNDRGVKLNVYGRSGTGKTTFACTFPKPLLLIGAEDGTRSVHNVKGVDYVLILSSDELTEVTAHAAKGHYQTVVLDAASSLQDMILKEILGLAELPAQKSWGMASREQYGTCSLQTKERLRALLNLACNVVIIAQEREFNSEGDSDLLMPYVGSALTPSVTGWLNPACDYIGQTFLRNKTATKETTIGGKTVKTTQKLREVEYCLRTGPDAVYTTKFRLPRGTPLPEVIVDPTFEKVDRLIRGK